MFHESAGGSTAGAPVTSKGVVLTMRRAATLTGTLALVLATVAVFAQAKPNFAGKWTLVPDPNAAPAGGRGGFGGLGASVTIAQDDKTLTVTRQVQGTDVKSVYNLDGSDSKNTMNFGGNAMDQVSKAKWDGNKLVITTSVNFGGNASELGTTYSLDASGNLIVESTRPDFQGGGAPVKTTATYKKG
jgi:hypothetical protein